MSCSSVVLRASVPAVLFVGLAWLASACAAPASPGGSVTQAPGSNGGPRAPAGLGLGDSEADPASWLVEAEQALDHEQPARAATLFARYLSARLNAPGEPAAALAQAYRGLAHAHEQLGDFEAAIRAYDGFLARFPDDPDRISMLARRGACEAEISAWDRSAASFAEVLEIGRDTLIPSQQVEAHARRGYALFQLERYDQAELALARADEIYAAATDQGEERFSDTYFVGLARFYRAAIVHLEFRAVHLRLPEAQLASDFERKLALLQRAQDQYNAVIRAKNVYWVAAAGYQLGSLFEEFHDAVMYAPVPEWLDETQRQAYYIELEQQLRPVIEKAIWVFEKNLETGRKLGYESEFLDRTEAQLAQLQAILLGRDDPGTPLPRLAPLEARAALDPDREIAVERLPAAERKLFVPMPTSL